MLKKFQLQAKKQVWRITGNNDGKSEGDYITLCDERPDQAKELYMFHPIHTYINKTVVDFNARPLLKDIFIDGKLIYALPNLSTVKNYATSNLESLWDEYKRNLNPEPYPVDLSKVCWDHKMANIELARQKVKEQDKYFSK